MADTNDLLKFLALGGIYMDVSIIIVNFNTKQLTLDAIRSVFQSKTRYSYEILLVDNNSTDGSVQAFRKEFPQFRHNHPRGYA